MSGRSIHNEDRNFDNLLCTGLLPYLVRGWHPYTALVLLCAFIYIPGLVAVPPLDRDESRFAQATMQMIETGDALRIRFQETERNKKPAGAYWFQAASVALLTAPGERAIWAHRLPSVIASILSVLICFSLGTRLVGRESAFVGSSLFAATVLMSLEAHQAKADALLLLTILVSQGALARIYLSVRAHGPEFVPSGGAWWIFWTGIGLGVMIKGPITPLVAGLTVLTLVTAERKTDWLRGLRAWPGILIPLVLVLPWAVGIGIVTEGRFFTEAIGHDLLGKVISGQESHGASPGFYVVLASLTGWPMTLAVVPGLIAGWKNRDKAELKFLLAWALPFWMVYELVPTKLLHYVLPTYPALALMAGMALVTFPDLVRSGFARVAAAVSTIAAVLLAATGMVMPTLYGSEVSPLVVVPGVVAALLALLAFLFIWRGAAVRAWLTGIAAATMLLSATWQVVLPRLTAFDVSGRIAEAVRAAGGGRLAAAGYHEPSLVFALGTDTLLLSPEAAAKALNEGTAQIVAVELNSKAAFSAALSAEVEEIGQVEGINYSRTCPVAISLYRLAR